VRALCLCVSGETNLHLHPHLRIFSALTVHCLRLRTLLIRRCPRVTELSLAPLRQRRLYIDRPQPDVGLNAYNLNDFYPSDFLVY